MNSATGHGVARERCSTEGKSLPCYYRDQRENTPKNKGRTMNKCNFTRRQVIKSTGVLAAGIAAPPFLRAPSAHSAYPERPVKIVVANTPGGPSDIVGRIVAAALEQSTGKTFIIENRGGGGGNIGFCYGRN